MNGINLNKGLETVIIMEATYPVFWSWLKQLLLNKQINVQSQQ